MPFIPIPAVLDACQAQLGVVPVIAQAGTALFPLLVLAVTSAIGLLLRPRALLQALRQRPWIPLALLALGCGGWWMSVRVAAAAPAPGPGQRQQPVEGVAGPRTDWARVALAIIDQDAAARAQAVAPVRAAAPSGAAPASVASNAPVAGAPGGSARCFRGDGRRSGYLGGTPPRTLIPGWNSAAGDDDLAMHLSSPMVVGDAVYGASCVLDPPTSSGRIFCLDAATGRQRWSCAAKGPPAAADFKGFISSPALTADGRFLVIGQGLHSDYDSELICLDAATGAVRWLAPTPLHIESSPSIEGDLVVAGVGAVEQGKDHRPLGAVDGHGNPGFILGVRISDGHEVFRATVADPEGSPLLSEGICYAGSGLNGSAVVALRTLSDAALEQAGQARVLWRTGTPFPATGAVTRAGDVLLVGCGNGDFVLAAEHPEGRVIALDKGTGAVLWQAPMPDAVLGPIAVSGQLAIVPVRDGEVLAIDLAARGRVLWRARVNRSAPVLAGAAIAGALVYAVSNDGYLVVLDAADGRQLEKVYLNAPGRPGELGLSTSSPLVVDGRLYVGSETGGLRCFVGSAP